LYSSPPSIRDALFTTAIFLILLKLKQQRKALFCWLAWGAMVIKFFGEALFPRARPPDVTCPEDDYSFPSGQARWARWL